MRLSFSAFLESRGGQLFACYLLALLAAGFSVIDHQTGTSLLNLIIGAILRDMQDGRATLPNQPATGQKET